MDRRGPARARQQHEGHARIFETSARDTFPPPVPSYKLSKIKMRTKRTSTLVGRKILSKSNFASARSSPRLAARFRYFDVGRSLAPSGPEPKCFPLPLTCCPAHPSYSLSSVLLRSVPLPFLVRPFSPLPFSLPKGQFSGETNGESPTLHFALDRCGWRRYSRKHLTASSLDPVGFGPAVQGQRQENWNCLRRIV